MHTRVLLAGPTDIAGFKRACRVLIAQQVAPAAVTFIAQENGGSVGLDTAENLIDASHIDESLPAPRLPASFVELCALVILHDDEARFARMFVMVDALLNSRAVWSDTLNPTRLELERMARAVRREIHKMKAFVRFRPVQDGERYVAWFEPAHHILEAVAPFFVRRFTNMNWAILTPRGSMWWDQHELLLGPPARLSDAPKSDAGEALWLTFYRHIFNPARLKIAAMKKEMPVRYWKNLPEAQQIAALINEAPRRTEAMVLAPPTQPSRRAPRAHGNGEDLSDLAQQASRCEACPLGEFATQLVWGRGAPRARLMLVGEQPGDKEDLQGEPFIGPAGQVLRKALAQLAWPLDNLYLTNAVKHVKFTLRGKRRLHKTPAQQEVDACSHWLEAEIKQIQPVAIVALGATAARALLRYDVRIGENAGKWLVRGDGLRVLIAAHPAALLRGPPELLSASFEQWVQVLSNASDIALT